MVRKYSILELLSVSVARELRDGELAFIGLGVGKRGFAMAVGVPSVAIRLSQLTHAPNIIAMYGALIAPEMNSVPPSFSDINLMKWPSRAQIPVEHALDMFKRGKIDVGFISGAQIDRFGNLNSVCIGSYKTPDVRLVGCIAQSDHASYAGRTIVIINQERRRFVKRVDFVSAVGHSIDGVSRKALGLRGSGPSKVFTNLAIFDFEPSDGSMRLASIHEGYSLDQVISDTDFDLVLPENVKHTKPPSDDELDLIRKCIDPKGFFLGGSPEI